MAEFWVATPRKRLILSALDFLARTAPALFRPRGDAGPDSGPARKILVLELWNIGDVVLTLPFLAQLRARFPEARVTLLGRAHAREILEPTGLVDEYIETDLGWSGTKTRFNPFGYRWRELWHVRGELARRRFDIAFKARMHVREHVVLAFSGARRRVGYAFGTGDSALTDPLPAPDADAHKTTAWLGLLAPFGGPVPVTVPYLTVTESERAWAGEYLRKLGVGDGETLIGIHPGASVPPKRWPVSRFADVARALSGQPRIRVLAFVDPAGTGAELGLIEGVSSARVELRQMMALIARCRLLLCNDSGPMHLAGAMGVSVVAVFGAEVARWFAPLGGNHELLSPDAQAETTAGAGVLTIPVSRVLAAVHRLLDVPPRDHLPVTPDKSPLAAPPGGGRSPPGR